MNKTFILMLVNIPIILAIMGFIPIWEALIFIIPVIGIFILDVERNGIIEQIIFLIVGGIVFIAIFPIVTSMITTIPTTTKINGTTTTTITNTNLFTSLLGSASTTTWNSSVLSLFTILMPLLIVISIVFRFMGIIEGEHYDDGYVRPTYRGFRGYSQYDYQSEQSEFEKEIVDMDTIFKRYT